LFPQLRRLGDFISQGEELIGGNLLVLQFAQQPAEPGGKSGQSRGGMKQPELGSSPSQQGAQDHDPAFLIQPPRRIGGEFAQDVIRQAVEGENLQPAIPLQLRARVGIAVSQQLAFELKGGLFRGEQQQGRAIGGAQQFPTDFGQAAEGLAAAGGTEEELRLHRRMVSAKWFDGKEFLRRPATTGQGYVCSGSRRGRTKPFSERF
jgi:hypothetical protein